ncbi:F-box/kelch-repeat protein At5g42350-like [Oryza brachyantha]|uniref:F-box/kelch-repeat protein At5g42350-like n=1 Tax=Oryza brachyantha TaxID=4533 RepID=UPI001ADBAA25|nr:F-box/kelch-repeat protein At5g42350-like [Oryza brachyantha]
MPTGPLQRSTSNSLAALLRADPPPNAGAGSDAAAKRTRRRRRRRRSCLRLPIGAAGACRVCACDEMDPAAAPRRRAPEEKDDDEGEEEEEEVVQPAVQCFSWKKGAAAAPASHRPSGAGDGDKVVVVVAAAAAVEASLSVLPDDVMEMVLCRLPLASLLAARCVCTRWRDLTVAPQFTRMRREEGRPHRTPWLFLFGAEGDGWGAAAAAGTAVHALDVAAQRWCRVGADGLRGRFLFSVAGVGDELYVVGGRSGGLDAGSVEAKTHKGVLVYSPLAGAWRKAAPMRSARSRPVLGVFEMSLGRRILHVRAEKHVHHANTGGGGGKFRLGGTSAVYEDPHRLSLRRLRLRDVLNEDADSLEFAPSDAKIAGGQEEERRAQPKLALIAVGGRGRWDEPLVSGEIYDPVTDKWFEIAGFPADVGLACSGAVCGQMFYVYCESDTLVAYHLDKGFWSVIQTSRPPPRLRDYAPALLCCSSRLLMLCVSWSDRDGGGAASRREKVVRKLFELDLGTRQWGEASSHPDAPMDPNAAFAAGGDTIYSVEMFRIFGKVLDFVTACRVSDTDDRRWCRLARKNAAADAAAMSSRLKSMAALHL